MTKEEVLRIGRLLAWGFASLLWAIPHGQAATRRTPMQQVDKYAGKRKVTVRRWHGNYWVEVDGVDAHGVGKTVDKAAQDFLYRADMLDHEKNPPMLTALPDSLAQWICPEEENCI